MKKKLLSLEDIKNLPDGTLIGFLSFGSFYGDMRFGIIDHVDGDQYIDFPEDCEAMNVDEGLFSYLKKDGVEFADGKVRAILYKEV